MDKLIGSLGCTQEHKIRILNKIANIIITDLYLITGIQSSTHKITLHYTWKRVGVTIKLIGLTQACMMHWGCCVDQKQGEEGAGEEWLWCR